MQEELENIAINNILAGNQSGCRYLIDRHKDMVFTLCLRLTRHREEAEEAAQDAFLKAFEALPKFNRQAKFSTWLYRIAYNCALERLRRKKPHTQDIEETPDIAGEEGLESAYGQLQEKNRQHYLKKALDTLTEEEAALITLYYFREQPMAEIAEITGLTPNTVKVKIHRARNRMQRALYNLLQGEAKELL